MRGAPGNHQRLTVNGLKILARISLAEPGHPASSNCDYGREWVTTGPSSGNCHRPHPLPNMPGNGSLLSYTRNSVATVQLLEKPFASCAPIFLPPRQSLSSAAQSCLTLWDPIDCSTPGFPVYCQLLEFTQIQVHWVGDTIQPSHPLSSPSPLAFSLSQHQGLF